MVEDQLVDELTADILELLVPGDALELGPFMPGISDEPLTITLVHKGTGLATFNLSYFKIPLKSVDCYMQVNGSLKWKL